MKQRFAGMAYKDGFWVMNTDNHVAVDSRRCPWEDTAILQKKTEKSSQISLDKNYRWVWFASLIILTILTVALSENIPFWQRAAILLFLPFAITEIFCLIQLIINFSSQELKQYHGCEHKIIYLLENELAPSMENLQKAPQA